MRKIPTLFRRDVLTPALITREVHPDCQWVLDGAGQATRKFDATCVGFFPAVRGEVRLGGVGSHEVNEPGDLTGVWLARREVKAGKTPPPGFVAVQHDEATGKTVGWEPVEQSSFAKVHTEALATGVLDEWPHEEPCLGATYELLGPKVNGNPEKLNDHLLVRHGYIAAVEREVLNVLPRDFDGLIEWLLADCEWEGIVWHGPDGKMAKLKVRDALAYVKAQDQAVAS